MISDSERRGGRQNRDVVGRIDDYDFFIYPKKSKKRILANDPVIKKYGEAYAIVYGATGPGEWGETWSPEQVSGALQQDMESTIIKNPFIIAMQDKERIAGFAYGYEINVGEFGDNEIAFSVTNDAQRKSELVTAVHDFFNNAGISSILYIKELGISKHDRGGFDKIYTFFKSVLQRGAENEKEALLFWTSRRKKLFPLVSALGAETIAEVGDEEDNVYMQADIKKCLQMFQQEPDALIELLKAGLGDKNRI